jgi:hypothetical protein
VALTGKPAAMPVPRNRFERARNEIGDDRNKIVHHRKEIGDHRRESAAGRFGMNMRRENPTAAEFF